MRVSAIVIEGPEVVHCGEVGLVMPGPADAVIAVSASAISTGTEKLFWSGQMPPFPGMGYPLVPGYEAIGEVVEAGSESGLRAGDRVFVPGSSGFSDMRGLFGAAASHVVTSGTRLTRVDAGLGDDALLLALAATGHHAIAQGLPDLIVGHGVLGRLIARITVALGGTPVVWETSPGRRSGGACEVMDPEKDTQRSYRRILDVSGDAGILDKLLARLERGGEIVLAGFYPGRVGFAFAPAFMKEALLRIAAEWTPEDMAAVLALLESGRLSLGGLITHRSRPAQAEEAYRTAFTDPACLKMILDWEERP